MYARKTTLPAMFVLAFAALALPYIASADPNSSFIELTVGDLTEFEIWENSQFSFDGEFYYNRVDGMLPYFGLEYRSETALHPRFNALVGWPSAHDGSYYKIHVEQPLFRQDGFSFGVDLYDRSAWSLEDNELISDFGNNLHAMFARIDQRDYYREEGVTVFAQHHLTPAITLKGEFRSVTLDSLSELEHVWTAFQRDHEWRNNPPITIGVLGGAELYDGGRVSSYVWSATYETRDFEEHTGWWARGIAEYAGQAAGSDYDFRVHRLEGEVLFPLTSTQSLSVYGLWGIGDGDDYPSHKLFHLGGRGNLRGYEYKEFAGKDVLFGRAEYTVRVTEPLEMIYYIESGEVGYGTTTPISDDSDGFKHDVGVGFRVNAPWDGWMRLDVARAMESDSELQVYLRLELAP
jgi:outer membrane protein assembly factor BamA